MHVTREITLNAPAEEVWRSLAHPTWLAEDGGDASIELRPDGDLRVGDRTGFVEEAEEPTRLVFWWSRPGEDATRVEMELEADGDETHLRVFEELPFAMLDLYGPEVVLDAPRPQQPELLAH
jgi:uncharacterized protein YndB with AHSA1/START domain